MPENLSSWFERFEPSQFEVYSEKYKDILMMTRRNGILEVRMHTDGGPLKFSWEVHSAWSHAWIDIGRDHENEVMILTGSGDRWLDANPAVWKTLFKDWTEDDKLKMYHESFRLLENLIFGLDIPTIAAINGPGTHCEIGTLCDITLCTEDADFFDPHFPHRKNKHKYIVYLGHPGILPVHLFGIILPYGAGIRVPYPLFLDSKYSHTTIPSLNNTEGQVPVYPIQPYASDLPRQVFPALYSRPQIGIGIALPVSVLLFLE